MWKVLSQFYEFYLVALPVRAWNDTKAFFGWNLRILIWPGLYLLGFLGLIRYKGLEFAMDEMISYIFLSLIPVGIGVLLIFAYNFVRAPIRLVGEQRGRIADLERQVRPPEDRREAIRARLEVAIREGNALLATLVTRSAQWRFQIDLGLTTQVAQWTQRIYEFLSENLPEYAGDFLPQAQRQGFFIGSPGSPLGSNVTDLADEVRQCLTRLREIIQRVG